MKITKLGHCCMLIEDKGVRILTDPGNFSSSQDEVMNVHVVLITHEHPDHLHAESLKRVLSNNPDARVITNHSVGKILQSHGIKFEVVADNQKAKEKEVTIEGFGLKHAPIYSTIVPVENTGYFISGRLFYPGDAFTNPFKRIEILALPVAGPWCIPAMAIEYAKSMKPNICFPVHDGMLIPERIGAFHMLPSNALNGPNTKFLVLELGKEYEF